ncbi:TonB-dependent siderophore receptor [Hyphococcus sp. DH-69]|uniref:TonB-dependent siderophore receptor n=1 Tax=Hyphococcus formosus TaxID=3143534 RepID=UPI00398B8569
MARKYDRLPKSAGRLLMASAATMAIIASPAWGQQGGEDDEIVVTGTRAVTATKTDTPNTEIPQSITVISLDQIKEQGALNIREALRYTAGVTSGGDDTRGDFNYTRGFFSATYLDGLKRNFGFVYTPRADPNTLERIEVLFGPSAVLYGAGSSGGLVNMQSKRPQFEFGGSASISYGTYDRKEAVLDVTGPLSDTVAARIVGVVRDANMVQRGTPDDRVVIQPSFTWQPSAATDVTLIGLFQRDYTGPVQYAPSAATYLADDLGFQKVSRRTQIGEPEFNKGPKRDLQATLIINHEFSDMLSFHSSSRYQDAHTEYGEIYGDYFSNPLDPFIDAGNTTVARHLFAINADYKVFNTANHAVINFDTGFIEHQVLVGADFARFEQITSQAFAFFGGGTLDIYNPVYGSAPAAAFGPEATQIQKSYGFYAQNQMRIADRASLVVGVRHDNVDQTDTFSADQEAKATTFRAGLTVDVTDTISPYGSYSQSFEPVSGLNQFGNSYVPLKGEQYEGGIKWQPLGTTLVRVGYYYIKEKNALRPDPSNPLTSIQTGTIKSEGFEVQADHRVPGDITLTASFANNSTLVSGEDRQRDTLPKNTASFFATKTIEAGDDLRFRFGAGVRYVSKRTSGDTASPLYIEVPSYTLVDAVVSAEYQDWELRVNAVNLLDKFYYSSCSHFGSCQFGDDQLFNATLSYRF